MLFTILTAIATGVMARFLAHGAITYINVRLENNLHIGIFGAPQVGKSTIARVWRSPTDIIQAPEKTRNVGSKGRALYVDGEGKTRAYWHRDVPGEGYGKIEHSFENGKKLFEEMTDWEKVLIKDKPLAVAYIFSDKLMETTGGGEPNEEMMAFDYFAWLITEGEKYLRAVKGDNVREVMIMFNFFDKWGKYYQIEDLKRRVWPQIEKLDIAGVGVQMMATHCLLMNQDYYNVRRARDQMMHYARLRRGMTRKKAKKRRK